MTKAEKINALITIAKELAVNLPAGTDLQRRAIHLACNMYRNRFGKLPTQTIIDAAIAQGF